MNGRDFYNSRLAINFEHYKSTKIIDTTKKNVVIFLDIHSNL